MSSDVLGFLGEFAGGNLLANFMDQVVVELFGHVVSMLEKCGQAVFTIASEFDVACVDIVEYCNGICHRDNSKDASNFALVLINVVWMSWHDMSSCDIFYPAIPLLYNEACCTELIFIRSIADCYGIALDHGAGYFLPVVWAVQRAYGPLVGWLD